MAEPAIPNASSTAPSSKSAQDIHKTLRGQGDILKKIFDGQKHQNVRMDDLSDGLEINNALIERLMSKAEQRFKDLNGRVEDISRQMDEQDMFVRHVGRYFGSHVSPRYR
ncbi:hypothetical protein K402DRAFT_174018 [Aulographum hederae CBS 113979]|uniref:Uncharacterized protein n=1 Tax=Aulographum hederae CBS 113979 TaxID=1176131 RepID=A0A6G1HDE7_9PEZI|nr:hypothetical protein K402DRAFT_174018 [Aulographum hederae CBS 113979]